MCVIVTYSRCRANNAQRKEICEYSKKTPPLAKHQEISEEFTRRYPILKLDRSTISKILNKKEQYLFLEDNFAMQKRYTNRH